MVTPRPDSPNSSAPIPSPFHTRPATSNTLAARTALTPHLPLPTLLPNLSSVTHKLSAATAAVAPFHTLHTQLHSACVSAARLADSTSTTIHAFRHATESALHDLALVGDLLADDLHPVAHRLLAAASDSTASLAADSHALALDFEQLAADVQGGLAATLQQQAVVRTRASALREQRTERSESLQRAQRGHESAHSTLQEAQALYEGAAAREAAAQRKARLVQAAQVAAMVGSVVTTRSAVGVISLGGATALAASVDSEALRAREERAVHLRQKQDARAERLECAKSIAEHTARLRTVRREVSISEVTIQNLETSVEALRTLGAVMLKVEAFWRQIRTHCNLGGDGSVLSIIGSAGEMPEGERRALWESERFQDRVKRLLAQWGALQEICDECIAGLGDTRKDMYVRLITNEGVEMDVETDDNTGMGLQQDSECVERIVDRSQHPAEAGVMEECVQALPHPSTPPENEGGNALMSSSDLLLFSEARNEVIEQTGTQRSTRSQSLDRSVACSSSQEDLTHV